MLDGIGKRGVVSVTINNTSNTVTSTDGKMSLLGNYSPVALTAGDNTVLYLGTHNKLYYPSKARTLNSFRANFQLNGIVAGDPQSGQQSIQSFKHNLDEDATGVVSVHSAQLFASSSSSAVTVHCSPRKVIKDGRLYIGEYNIAGQRTK